MGYEDDAAEYLLLRERLRHDELHDALIGMGSGSTRSFGVRCRC